ncbi:hypothetical protein OIU85_011397 [Salix viminalis]|uniref:Uncharacterized protein n=1 Tax=Salix viminalis TaxID=40686 RepID=A0A9Q0SFL4_SALVM|nr:hypothetical protein OIU85_011397 [Salix viminalis]
MDLWWDCWSPIGSIASTCGNELVHETGIPSVSMVADVIDHGSWCWPCAGSEVMDSIQCAGSLISLSATEDQIIWKASSDGKFSSKCT